MEISCLTVNDYISIVSTFTTMTDSNFNCARCKVKYKGSPERQALLFKQKACDFISPNSIMQYSPSHSMTGSSKILYNTCPANFYNSGIADYINLLPNYKKGIMPYGGGLLEQPAKFVEVMDLVHNLTNEKQAEKEELLKRRGK